MRATNATANATANVVAGNRTPEPGAAIEKKLRLLLVGGVKEVPRLLPASSSRDDSHLNMGGACVWCVCHLWRRDLKSAVKKDNTFGQPDPVQKKRSVCSVVKYLKTTF